MRHVLRLFYCYNLWNGSTVIESETDGKELLGTDNMKAKTNLEEDFDVLYRNHKFEPDTSIELGKESKNRKRKEKNCLWCRQSGH